MGKTEFFFSPSFDIFQVLRLLKFHKIITQHLVPTFRTLDFIIQIATEVLRNHFLNCFKSHFDGCAESRFIVTGPSLTKLTYKIKEIPKSENILQFNRILKLKEIIIFREPHLHLCSKDTICNKQQIRSSRIIQFV